MSHDIVGKYSNRGTLTADGHFIREAKGKPVLDGEALVMAPRRDA